MAQNTRKYTHALVDALSEGYTTHEAVVTACLNVMSEADIQDMCESEELLPAFVMEELENA